jgi:lysophospholipase L1-like esterase
MNYSPMSLACLFAVGGLLLVLPACAAKGWPLPPALKGVARIAFYGDSLTDGSDYPEYVINTLNMTYGTQLTFVNGAVVGHRARDLVNRLDRDILSQKPDLTFILIGTNDSGPGVGYVPVIQYKAELIYLCRRLKAAGSKVGLITLTGSTDPKMVERFLPYEETIVAVAKAEGALLVDAWTLFGQWQAAGKEMYYAPGDAHHSALGFQGLARAILTALGVPETVELDLTIAPPANLLTHWEESGPVAKADPSLVTEWMPYDASKWIATKDWSWKPLVQRGAWFALQGEPKGRTAFARTTYTAAKEGVYELQLGGSTPLIVWVNGVKVFTLPVVNGYHPNAVRTPVWLKKGANELILTTGFYAYVGIKALE